MTPPTLDELYAPFSDRSDRPQSATLAGDAVPEPYRSLLVHTHHMTVAVEKFYGAPVDVRVLESIRTGDEYARKILLALRGTGQVVQFGLVHVSLDLLAPAVRDEILGGKTPLGRVLIEHDVLRTVRPSEFFEATLSPTMREWFGLREAAVSYGRIGVITADDRPAVRVVEVLAPIPA